jgi:hypothetical protein
MLFNEIKINSINGRNWKELNRDVDELKRWRTYCHLSAGRI